MKLWMDVMRDLESVMNDYEPILDAWAEGGVDGVVLGPLVFGTSKLSKDAQSAPTGDVVSEAYDPNPEVYKRLPLSEYGTELAAKTGPEQYEYMTQMLLDT